MPKLATEISLGNVMAKKPVYFRIELDKKMEECGAAARGMYRNRIHLVKRQAKCRFIYHWPYISTSNPV